MAFYEKMKEQLQNLTHSLYSIRILDEIFSRPIFSSNDFVVRTEIPRTTANKLLTKMKKTGILREFRPGSGRHSTIYAFRELLNITGVVIVDQNKGRSRSPEENRKMMN